MSSTFFRPDIQGLRAIAVLAVIAFHFNPAWLPGGYVGVDVFLVISGFLITSILINKRREANYSFLATLKYFYFSRFKRIMPAYFAMLVTVSLVAAVFFLPKDFEIFTEGLQEAAWFNSNNYFADFGDYFAPANHEQPLLHTWSLAVEIQFYLLVPFIVLYVPERQLKWVFAVLLVSLTAIAEYRLRYLGIEQATYYSLYARLPEFFAGSLAALYIRQSGDSAKRHSWLGGFGLALILLSAIAQPALGTFPGLAAMLPVFGSVLLLSRPSHTGWIGLLLSNRILVWIGALSYSLYLWHWPVLAFLRYYTGAEVLSLGFSFLFCTLTLFLSALSFYGIEKVFSSVRTTRKQVVGWMLLASGVFGTSQTMATMNDMFTPEPLPVEYQRYADPAKICHGKIVGDCLRGDLDSDKEVLVLGDSHAAMLNHFFDYLGKELGFKARVITASSCVTIPGFDYERIPEWAQASCTSQIEVVENLIKQARIIIVAGMWSFHAESNKFREAYRAFLDKNPTQKFIFPQVPEISLSANKAERFKEIGLESSVGIKADYQVANTVIGELTENRKGSIYMRLNGDDFFEKAPFYRGTLIYSDTHHLNEVGALAYAVSLKKQVRERIVSAFNQE